MSTKTIGFIGGGRVARILLGGWVRAGSLPGDMDVVVSDSDERVLARLKETHSQVRTLLGGNEEAASQDVVFLALHPPAIAAALPALKSSLKAEAILVSLAPKLTIARLSGMLGGFRRIARMIPNAPSIVGEGFNPIAYGDALPEGDRAELAGRLDWLGRCPAVAEEKLEAYALVTAMGPTYFWPQLYELCSLGESFGLSSSEAAEGVQRMLAGAMATMTDSGLDAAGVQDLIPVKPLAELEPVIREGYRTKLTGLMERIRP